MRKAGERYEHVDRQYAEKGEIDAALLAQIGTPMIPEDMYARIANGEQ